MASSDTSIFENFDPVSSTVQELIKSPLTSIPPCYIVRSDHEEKTINANSFSTTIPTLDFKLLLSTDSEIQKLHSTCKEWGIFQLVNHGISLTKLEELNHEIEGFYKLPIEERLKYKMRPGDGEGYGSVYREKGKLDWGDAFFMVTNPVAERKPHLLPQLPSALRVSLENYIMEIQKLAMKLLDFVAEALKMDKKEMEIFDDGRQTIRMSYYPPCPQPELAVGITPHSDGTGITILHQVNKVDGLQIKKDGVWMPVSFLPNALLVNLGDILQILSNKIYRSIEHKVTVNPEKERISISFFCNPKSEAEIGPVCSLINPENPPIYKRIMMKDYLKGFYSRKLGGKSFMEQMELNHE